MAEINTQILVSERRNSSMLDVMTDNHPIYQMALSQFVRRKYVQVANALNMASAREMSKLRYTELMAIEEAAKSHPWLVRLQSLVKFYIGTRSIMLARTKLGVLYRDRVTRPYRDQIHRLQWQVEHLQRELEAVKRSGQ